MKKNNNFLYKSNFFNTFFNSFCKNGNQVMNENFFYSLLHKTKKISGRQKEESNNFFIFVWVLLEFIFLYRLVFSIKLIKRGKYHYRIPYRIVKKNLYRYSLKNLLKIRSIDELTPSPIRIFIDKEKFMTTVYKNRLLVHYR